MFKYLHQERKRKICQSCVCRFEEACRRRLLFLLHQLTPGSFDAGLESDLFPVMLLELELLELVLLELVRLELALLELVLLELVLLIIVLLELVRLELVVLELVLLLVAIALNIVLKVLLSMLLTLGHFYVSGLLLVRTWLQSSFLEWWYQEWWCTGPWRWNMQGTGICSGQGAAHLGATLCSAAP